MKWTVELTSLYPVGRANVSAMMKTGEVVGSNPLLGFFNKIHYV